MIVLAVAMVAARSASFLQPFCKNNLSVYLYFLRVSRNLLFTFPQLLSSVEVAHVLLVVLFVKVYARALVATLAIFKADFGKSNFLCCNLKLFDISSRPQAIAITF